MLLAALVVASPQEEVLRLSAFRSNVLHALGDLSLTNEQAMAEVSDHINRVLGVSAERRGYWTDLMTRKETYTVEPVDETVFAAETAAAAQETLDRLLTDLKHMAADDKTAEDQLVLRLDAHLKAAVGQLVDRLKPELFAFMDRKLRWDFAYSLTHLQENLTIKASNGVALELIQQIFDALNRINEDEDLQILVVEEEYAFEVQKSLLNHLKPVDVLAVELGQVLRLLANGAYQFRVEALYMFNLIQVNSEELSGVSAAARLDRMKLVMSLLVTFAEKKDGEADQMVEVEKFVEALLSHRREIIRGNAKESPEFAPLYRAVVRDLLYLLKSQEGKATAYKLAKSFVAGPQEVSQAHLVDFLKPHIARNGFPVITRTDLAPNDKDLLKAIAILTALPYEEVKLEWFESILAIFDRLLAVHPNAINTLGYATIQLHAKVTPYTAETAPFLDAYFNSLLLFIEYNGEQVSPDGYYEHLDTFLDLYADLHQDVRQFYLLMKLQNVYATPSAAPFKVDFKKIPTETDQVKALKAALDDPAFKTLSAVAWNTYVKLTGNKKKSNKDNADHLTHFLGQTGFRSEDFPHANFQMPVIPGVQVTRPETKLIDVKVSVTHKEALNTLTPRMTPFKTPANKITVDGGLGQGAKTPLKDIKEEEDPRMVTPELVRTKPNHHVLPEDLVRTPELVRTKPNYHVLPEDLTGSPQPTKKGGESDSDDEDLAKYLPTRLVRQHAEEDDLADHIPNQLVRKNAEDGSVLPSPPKLVRRDDSEFVVGPTLARQNSIIPDDNLEKLAEEQVKETEAREKIEEQVTRILEDESPEVKPEGHESPAEGEVEVHEIQGALTPQETRLLEQPNLEDILNQLTEITDELGNVTNFAYVKIIPKRSDCFKTLFG